MEYRWDLVIPTFLVMAYAAIFWTMGYIQGKKRTEAWHRLMADVNRVRVAQDKQLYDWSRDGI